MSEAKRFDRYGAFFEIHLKGYIINKMVLSTQCINLCAECYDKQNEWSEKKNEYAQSGDTQIKD